MQHSSAVGRRTVAVLLTLLLVIAGVVTTAIPAHADSAFPYDTAQSPAGAVASNTTVTVQFSCSTMQGNQALLGASWSTMNSGYPGTDQTPTEIARLSDHRRYQFSYSGASTQELQVVCAYAGSSRQGASVFYRVAIPTTTTLSGATEAMYGGGAQLAATVASSTGTPGGDVTFHVDGSDRTVALSGGTATLPLGDLSSGSHTITADYPGSGDYTASSSNSWQVQVTGAPSSVSVSAAAAIWGEHSTATVHVTSVGTPTGDVSYSVDGSAASRSPLSGGNATLDLGALSVGTHTLDVSYLGDTYRASANAARANAVVDAKATSLTLTASPSWSPGLGAVTKVTATVTSGSDPVTEGAVQFTVGAVTDTPPIQSDGTATELVPTGHAGAVTIDATYHDATGHHKDSSSSRSLDVQRGAPEVVASVLPRWTYGDVPATLASVNGDPGAAGPTGSIGVRVDGDAWPHTTPTDGGISADFSALRPGAHEIAFIYGGDDNYEPDGRVYDVTVDQRSVQLTVAVDLATDDSLRRTRTASVHLDVEGVARANTTVDVTIDGIHTTTTTDSDGHASVALPAATAGTHSVAVHYSDAAGLDSDADDSTDYEVTPGTPSLSVQGSESWVYGGHHELQLTVDGIDGAAAPTGTIAVYDGADRIDTVPLASPANVDLSALVARTHQLTFEYSGDPNYDSAEAPATIAVTAAPTSTSLDGLTVWPYGDTPPVLTATVTGVVDPTGGIAFSLDGEPLSDAPVDASGQATLSVPTLLPGAHTIGAAYSGDERLAASSGELDVSVEPAPTAVSIGFVPDAVDLGEAATAVVTVTSREAPVTTGSVSVVVGTADATDYTLDDDGTASVRIPTRNAGSVHVAAHFTDPTGLLADADDEATLLVAHGAAGLSAIVPSRWTYGDAVSPVATVAGVEGAAEAAGTVQLLVDDREVGDGEDVGAALPSLAALAPGAHHVEVRYSGDENYNEDSVAVDVTVDRAPATVAIDLSGGSTWHVGDLVRATATVRGVEGSGLARPGSAQLSADGGVALGADGVMAWPVGTYLVTAAFAGDAYYTAATASVRVTVLAAPPTVGPSDIPPAARLTVSTPSTSIASEKTHVRAHGLAPHEAYTIRIASRKVATGHANSRGTVDRHVTVPARTTAGTHTVVVAGATKTDIGRDTTRVYRLVKPKVSLDETWQRASRDDTVTVSALLPGERVVITYNGKRISPKSAATNTKGRYTLTFDVGTAWGRRALVVTAKHNDRTTRSHVTVSPFRVE